MVKLLAGPPLRRELERGLVLAEVEQAGNILRVPSGTGAPALKAIMFALQSRFGWSHYAAALSSRQTDTIQVESRSDHPATARGTPQRPRPG